MCFAVLPHSLIEFFNIVHGFLQNFLLGIVVLVSIGFYVSGIRNKHAPTLHFVRDHLKDYFVKNLLENVGIFKPGPPVPANGGVIWDFVRKTRPKNQR